MTLRTDLLAERTIPRVSDEKAREGKAPANTSIRISPKVLGKLDAEAETLGASRNELIVLLIDAYLISRSGKGIDEIDPSFAAYMKKKRRRR